MNIIHTECKCGEELVFDDAICAEHEHWWCPTCYSHYTVPYEIIRFFEHKELEI
jgi:hypothetical protein